MTYKHNVWMSIAAFWLGITALVTLPWRSPEWGLWLAAAYAVHITLALVISVGVSTSTLDHSSANVRLPRCTSPR